MNKKDILCGGGHGGKDTGAIAFDGSYEKTYALQLSLEVYEKLEKAIKNYKITLLKDKDVYMSLSNRCKIANSLEPIYWFEFHFNAYNGKAKGIEIIASNYTSQENKNFVSNLCSDFANEFNVTNRGILLRKLSNGQDYYYLNRNTNAGVTTFIVEPLFIDNEDDFKVLKQSDFMDRASTFFAKNISEKIYGIPYTEDNKLYVVQCGAFKNLDNAKNLKNELIEKGFDAIIK